MEPCCLFSIGPAVPLGRRPRATRIVGALVHSPRTAQAQQCGRLVPVLGQKVSMSSPLRKAPSRVSSHVYTETDRDRFAPTSEAHTSVVIVGRDERARNLGAPRRSRCLTRRLKQLAVSQQNSTPARTERASSKYPNPVRTMDLLSRVSPRVAQTPFRSGLASRLAIPTACVVIRT